MNKKMDDWVSCRIKEGATMNLSSINRREISVINNIKIFLFYRRIFFWDNVLISLEDILSGIKEKFIETKRKKS